MALSLPVQRLSFRCARDGGGSGEADTCSLWAPAHNTCSLWAPAHNVRISWPQAPARNVMITRTTTIEWVPVTQWIPATTTTVEVGRSACLNIVGKPYRHMRDGRTMAYLGFVHCPAWCCVH